MEEAEDVRDDALVRLMESHAELQHRTANLELTLLVLAVFNLMCWVSTWF